MRSTILLQYVILLVLLILPILILILVIILISALVVRIAPASSLQVRCSSFPNGNDQQRLSTCRASLNFCTAAHAEIPPSHSSSSLPVALVMAFKSLTSPRFWSGGLYLLAIMQAVLGLDLFTNHTLSLPGAASYVAAVGFPTSVFA